jgi:isopentenyl diphosphate isomerase/L-lactate dehydrogenase-like FMN-dependent dehydrogenase
MAHSLLKPALKDKKSTELELDVIARELRIAMFLVGADTVEKLSTVEVKYGLKE